MLAVDAWGSRIGSMPVCLSPSFLTFMIFSWLRKDILNLSTNEINSIFQE